MKDPELRILKAVVDEALTFAVDTISRATGTQRDLTAFLVTGYILSTVRNAVGAENFAHIINTITEIAKAKAAMNATQKMEES